MQVAEHVRVLEDARALILHSAAKNDCDLNSQCVLTGTGRGDPKLQTLERAPRPAIYHQRLLHFSSCKFQDVHPVSVQHRAFRAVRGLLSATSLSVCHDQS